MKQTRSPFAIYLLLLSVFLTGLPAQSLGQRERRTDAQQQVPAQQPSPSPSPVASPVAIPQSSPEPAVPAPKVAPAATLPELQVENLRNSCEAGVRFFDGRLKGRVA